MGKKMVCCIFGGKSTEYDVSLISAKGVISNIDTDKYDVLKLGITREGKWYLYDGDVEQIADNTWKDDSEKLHRAIISPSFGDNCLLVIDGEKITAKHLDVVFPVLHGANGEDGTIQGLLTLAGIPFVGVPCLASAVAMDKSFTKMVIKNFGIPQARAIMVEKRELEKSFDIIRFSVAALGYPVFVKPSNAGSSIGVSRVADETKLRGALEEALRYDSKALVEEAIVGKEVEVAVMGNEDPVASCVGEIDPGGDVYDYETKYISDQARYYVPARISEKTAETLRTYAVRIFRALGCRGLSRVDFFVREDGSVIFNEINTLPGFTPISMYPKLFIEGGMTYGEIVDRLIELALENKA